MSEISQDLFLPVPLPEKETVLQTENKTLSIWRSPFCCSGLFLLSVLLLIAFIGPFISGYPYDETHLALKNHPPSKQFWFGSDDLGRDLFTRTCFGMRLSLLIGIAAACIDCIVGLVWGGIAGLIGEKVDFFMMRIVDILYSLPYLLLVILLIVVFGSGLFSILLALTLLGWTTMARIIRGQILLLKEMEYVLAARTMGASIFHLLMKHLFPNALGPIMVTLTLTIPSAIFSEAFLSFMGLGVQAPMASLGSMAYEGLPSLEYYPWRIFFPALLIILILFSFQLIAEGLKMIYGIHEKSR